MAAVREYLERALQASAPAGTPVCVAFSGGLDSTVLVHALARLRDDGHLCSLRAAHVDHGLQAASGKWRRHCERFCLGLGVPFVALAADNIDVRRGGLEAAAREARYRALEDHLRPGEWLATAHHQGDQAETLLLRLLRGSGPVGLSAIPPLRPFGAGRLWRPLLDLPRESLRAYAASADLDWTEDPSNVDLVHDRNFLRAQVIPALRSRWPAAQASIARGAELCRDSLELLDELAAMDLTACETRGRIAVDALAELSLPRARNLLRYYLRRRGLQAPCAPALEEGLRQLLDAGPDTDPRLRFPGGEFRRYRGRLYLVLDQPVSDAPSIVRWDGRGRLRLSRGGCLTLESNSGGGLDPGILRRALSVRYRRGGERLQRPGQRHSQALKKLFQAAGVPPWVRQRTPLLYAGDELAAVGNLWVSARYGAEAGRPGLSMRWADSDDTRAT